MKNRQIEWDDFSKRFYKENSGSTYTTISDWVDLNSKNSYQVVADTIRSPGSILDLACGPGDLMRYISSDKDLDLYGVDFSPTEIDEAKKNYGHVCSYTTADASSLPYEDHKFDQVICHMSLHVLSDPLGAVSEIKRVLKPGGYFSGIVRRKGEEENFTTTVFKFVSDYVKSTRPELLKIQPKPINTEDQLRDTFDSFSKVDVFPLVFYKKMTTSFLVDYINDMYPVSKLATEEKSDLKNLVEEMVKFEVGTSPFNYSMEFWFFRVKV